VLALALALAAAAGSPAPTCIAPDGARVRIELAVTDEARALGLMFRDALSADAGMLFLFDSDGRVPFWMKNTFIPLDMIWISATGEVVDVHAGVRPCKLDPCPNVEPARPGRAVLEVNAGFAAGHGIRPGAVLTFRDVPDFPIPGGKR
jgi:uncharacterized membrane protein (UPF0127 family)